MNLKTIIKAKKAWIEATKGMSKKEKMGFAKWLDSLKKGEKQL